MYSATSIIRTSILVYTDTDKPRSDIRGPKVLRGIRFRSVSVDFVRLNKVVG